MCWPSSRGVKVSRALPRRPRANRGERIGACSHTTSNPACPAILRSVLPFCLFGALKQLDDPQRAPESRDQREGKPLPASGEMSPQDVEAEKGKGHLERQAQKQFAPCSRCRAGGREIGIGIQLGNKLPPGHDRKMMDRRAEL